MAACTQCGAQIEALHRFCPQCGKILTLQERLGSASQPPRTLRWRIPVPRAVLFSLLSFGFYLFYWAYATWKQYREQTGARAYPVWHALSFVIPIYSLFQMHKHVRTYRDLAARAGTPIALRDDLAVSALAASWVLGITSLAIGFAVIGASHGITVLTASLSIAETVLMAALVGYAQGHINRLWTKMAGDGLRNARIGVIEVLMMALGAFYWISVIQSLALVL